MSAKRGLSPKKPLTKAEENARLAAAIKLTVKEREVLYKVAHNYTPTVAMPPGVVRSLITKGLIEAKRSSSDGSPRVRLTELGSAHPGRIEQQVAEDRAFALARARSQYTAAHLAMFREGVESLCPLASKLAPGVYLHQKTNVLYRVIGLVRDATNGANLRWMVQYVSLTYGEMFVREASEFLTDHNPAWNEERERFKRVGPARLKPPVGVTHG
jgi:hypothetical protein